ncbi:hypothetical protein [Mycobacterium sp. DL440]|uniref:hypothetical protein n=1 Tax=Mycobacterium sp. DL440 TaxID=2675523 RepID=UPI0014220F7C|nr:hypothetical protein [Mycobacterium sp. DL440]
MSENPNLDKLKEWFINAYTERMSKCIKCGRPSPEDRDEKRTWGMQNMFGFVYQVICPDCMTPEQLAECQIRDATETISTETGRIVRKPKKFDDDEGGEGAGRDAETDPRES